MKKSVVNEVAGYGMQFYNKYISLHILKTSSLLLILYICVVRDIETIVWQIDFCRFSLTDSKKKIFSFSRKLQ